MVLENQNILFFTRTMKLGGTENVILQLCEILKPLVNKIVVCSCGGVNVEKLTAMGIKHYEIPDIEQKNPRQMLTVVLTLKKIIREENITVIHTHHRMAAFYCSVFNFRSNIKRIHTAHGVFVNKKLLTRIALGRMRIVACGENVKQNLCTCFHINPQRVTVIVNAVRDFQEEPAVIDALSSLRTEGNLLVGNISRLSAEKGVDVFLRAIPYVSALQNVKYIIVGTGEEENRLKELVDILEISDRVLFLGYRKDVQNVLSQLDFAVLSSHTEGLPLTPIEAFSVGKTMVATSAGGTAEIVKNEINGLTVPCNDPLKLAAAISRLVSDSELRRNLEKAAYNTYREAFSYDSFTEKYLNYYQSL